MSINTNKINSNFIPIGIDLGTTISCVCAYKDNKVEVCLNSKEKLLTPSYVNIDNDITIGENVKNNINKHSFYNIKRFIGKKYNNQELQNDLKFCLFDYEDNNNELKLVNIINDKKYLYSPEEISGLFLKKLKEETETYLKCLIKDCVITVPAYFNNKQRELTKKAGELAGFNVLQIINEPTSASIAYSLNNNNNIKGNILIFDWGGGTLDISILDVTNNVIEIKNSDGDNHLGGEDIDNILIQYCLSYFIKINNINNKDEISNIIKNKNSLQKLKLKCEDCKKLLSINNVAFICIKKFHNNIDLNIEITRELFVKLNKKIFDYCKILINKTIKDFNKLDISDIVLIGGSTRIPELYNILKNEFPNCIIHNDIDPDISVAFGACIHCYNLLNEQSCKNILIDVTSHSIGFEVDDKYMHIIIPKNTIIPCSYKDYFTTKIENQRNIIIKVFEGEEKETKNNLFIKNIIINDIPPSHIGELKYEIEFKIDENNILSIFVNKVKF